MSGTVLVVCTANICRSPMAAALLERHLAALGSSMRVVSAGIHATAAPVAADAIAVMAERGLDISAHEARLLARDDVRYASVVLTMERAHVAHIVAMEPPAFAKTFCLRELVALASQRGPRRAEEALDAWLARLHLGRRAADVLRTGADLDVVDPFGRSRDAFERCAQELDELTGAVASLVG